MNKSLRLVAWFEVLTGTFMMLHAVIFLSSKGIGAVTLNEGVLAALGTLGLFAGIALFRKKTLAWLPSVVLQVLLIPAFLVGTIAFRPGLGVFIPAGVNLPETGSASVLYEFSLGVDFMVSFNAVQRPQYVAVNLAAVACLFILLRHRHVSGKRV